VVLRACAVHRSAYFYHVSAAAPTGLSPRAKLARLRSLLVAAVLAAAGLSLAACGGGTRIASKGDCTDADPTLVIPSIKPAVVDCASPKATSKIVAETDDPGKCTGKAYIKTTGDTVFCLAPVPGRTFDDQMNRATKKGEQNQRQFQRRMDELKRKLKKQGSQESP
jgi:hypothetical protein